jgi:high-affinity nickel permease
MGNMNIKEKIEKLKQISLTLTTKIVSVVAYWLGVSLSFLLWKISTIFKKETKKSFWIESEEQEEDYKRQY